MQDLILNLLVWLDGQYDFITHQVGGALNLCLLLLSIFFGACISTAVGLGGGVVVIAGATTFLPIWAVLPLQGLNQFTSGIMRSWIFRREVQMHFFGLFSIGSVIGCLLAANFLVNVPAYVLKFSLGVGIMTIGLMPQFKGFRISHIAIVALGLITGFLTMFIGLVGPIVAIILTSQFENRYHIVATTAWCMTFQNFIKVALFGTMVFDYMPWVLLVLLFVAVSYLGVKVGKKLLDRTNNKLFKAIIKGVSIVTGGKLIGDGIGDLESLT